MVWPSGRCGAFFNAFEVCSEVKKKLKVFRLEAVIVAVANKTPVNVLEEDPKRLM